MALFKIFKGHNTDRILNPNDPNWIPEIDGYAYYDTSSRLFYIDAEYPINDSGEEETFGLDRRPINAAYAYNAYADALNNRIHETYIKSIVISGTNLTYTRGNDVTTTLGIPMIEYTGGLGITINDNDEIVNAGVRAIASGSEDGTISVNTNGNTRNVAVAGLKDLAYISKPATGSNTVFLNSNGTWNEIPAATTEQLGGVKIGSGLNVDGSGALNVKLSSSVSSTATDYAATSYAVK